MYSKLRKFKTTKILKFQKRFLSSKIKISNLLSAPLTNCDTWNILSFFKLKQFLKLTVL